MIDEGIKNFIGKELEAIAVDKERVTDEQKRIWKQKNILQSKDIVYRTDLEQDTTIFLQTYYKVLSEQFNLICKREICIYDLIAEIGKSSQARYNQNIN